MGHRIPFDCLCLSAAAGEIRGRIQGGVVQKAAMPVPLELRLTVRRAGANSLLLLSCDARWARVHLSVSKARNPTEPPPFCMVCRKHLEGATLVSVDQPRFDRIIDLHFVKPGGETVILSAELMGRHSNLILAGPDGKVLDAAKRISRAQSRVRQVFPGADYTRPPSEDLRFDLLREEGRAALLAVLSSLAGDSDQASKQLLEAGFGLSPFLARELACGPESVATALAGLREGRWEPVRLEEGGRPAGAYPMRLRHLVAYSQHAIPSFSKALDDFHETAIPLERLEAARRDLEGRLSAALKARVRVAADLRAGLSEARSANRWKENGDLILANVHRIPPEAFEFIAEDLYAPVPTQRAIPLDPALSPAENAERCFRKYRRLRHGLGMIEERLHLEEERARRLRRALDDLPGMASAGSVAALRAELEQDGLLRSVPETADSTAAPGDRNDFGEHRIRRHAADGGWILLWGENASSNDYLTTRLASPGDTWLHVRSNPSAHVVLKGPRGTLPPRELLEQAALIAARHSAAKHSAAVAVDYTLKKHVRKPRGAPPGSVVYQNEKTLIVDPRR